MAMDQAQSINNYDESKIKVLRRAWTPSASARACTSATPRPRGLHHLVWEIVDNSIDEAMAGRCKNITVTINADGIVHGRRRRRRHPRRPAPARRRSPRWKWSCASCTPAASSTTTPTRSPAACTAWALSVVNALSRVAGGRGLPRRQRLPAWSSSAARRSRELKKIGTAQEDRHQGHLQARPARSSPTPTSSYEVLADAPARAGVPQRGPAHQAPGRADRTRARRSSSTRACMAFVQHLNEGKDAAAPADRHPQGGRGRRSLAAGRGHPVQRRLQRDDLLLRQQHQHRRGRHAPVGLQDRPDADAQRLRHATPSCSRTTTPPTGEDLREGLTAIVSVKVPDPQFEGQTKTKLGNSEVESFVTQAVNEQLGTWLEEHPADAKRIVQQGRPGAAGPRGRPQGPRPDPPQGRPVQRRPARQAGRLPQPRRRHHRAVPGRGRFGRRAGQAGPRPAIQAILPLRGKILNVEKARIDKILSSRGNPAHHLGPGLRHRRRGVRPDQAAATARSSS